MMKYDQWPFLVMVLHLLMLLQIDDFDSAEMMTVLFLKHHLPFLLIVVD